MIEFLFVKVKNFTDGGKYELYKKAFKILMLMAQQ